MYTIVIPDQIPLSQNQRHERDATTGLTRMDEYRTILTTAFNTKYGSHIAVPNFLYGKVFWTHRVGDDSFDSRDADNFSKPLWDALNRVVYNDDRQIRLCQTAKLQHDDTESLTVNVDNMDDNDLEEFLNFHLDSANPHQNWLYIEIGDFKHSHIKFGEE